MKRTLVFLLCLALAFGFALSPARTVKAEDGYKDTVVFGMANEQNSFDPAVNSSNNVVLPNVYTSLISINNDNELEPGLATEWWVADDQVTWTFKLREGVKFHSGKVFDADDCVATFSRLMDSSLGLRQSSNYVWIEEVYAEDPLTFVLVSKEPYGAVEGTMSHKSAGIVNAEFVAQYGEDLALTPESIDGTGPYKVVEINPGETVLFEAFEDYYGGAPKTQYILHKLVPDQAARAVAVETGEVDIVTGIAPDDVERFSDDENDGVVVFMNESNGIHLFQFNVASPNEDNAMSKPLVRQAISYALDREEICDALYGALGEKPAHSLLSPSVIGYVDMGYIEQDYDKAVALLEEAGYADGLELKIMTTAVYNKGVEMAEIMVEQLKGAGISATLEVVERAVFIESLEGYTPEEYNEKYGWDLFIMGAGGDVDAHQSTYRVFHSSPTGTNENNYGFYANAEVDKLLEDAAANVDPVSRVQMYQDAMQILIYDDPIGVTMNQRNNVYCMTEYVESFILNAGNTADWKVLQVRED